MVAKVLQLALIATLLVLSVAVLPIPDYLALACEALAVVVWSDDWEPTSDPEEVYVKLPSGFHDLDESPTTLPSTRILCNGHAGFRRVAIEHVHIHSGVELPNGYHLAYTQPYLTSEVFPFNSPLNKKAPLCRSQSWVKITISIAQLCYSSVTIYQT
ncbi:hypothetical protein JAAARDRAFT_198631 [Jaapia argillacea MUCL 33604]|uniref:Uncharacterized protein n=1 Tax=Jaapia argillacea MUCL 33604 TaxID=933084 RepID=A0A067PLV4_9AGAM|nr:hypothetical protein JAAARDRAFT_198631 [Jaapia argillacea MUCL 33604]